MRKVRPRHSWAVLATAQQGAGERMQTDPVLLYTSSGLALQATQMCTQVGDTRVYFRHTHSSKFSSTDYS